MLIEVAVQIFAEFSSREDLLRALENDLKKGRAFVAGEFDVTERQRVELVLVHPDSGEWVPLQAEVVYIAPPEQAGVGLEIVDFSAARLEVLEQFVHEPPPAPVSEASPDPTADPLVLEEPRGEDETDASARVIDVGAALSPSSSRRSPSGRPSSMPPGSQRSQPPPKNVQERVRNLNIRERDKVARSGTLTERVALERAYGGAVWDALLSNASLTGPEVARIAKNGNATIPHLKQIVSNPAWLSKGEVRRALLTNPRLPPRQIERVLRALSPMELRQLPKQTAYSPKVRQVAQRLIKD